MVEHVVLFKLSAAATEADRTAAIEALKGLKDQIPGIVQATAGINFSNRNQGYELGLVVRFENRAALETYLPHPAHRGCVDRYITPFKEDVIVVDYEI